MISQERARALNEANYNIACGLWKEAEQLLRKGLQTNKDTYLEYTSLGVLYGKINQTELAIEAFRSALENNPTHIPALLGLGMLSTQQGNLAVGTEYLRQASKLAPKNSSIWFNLGLAYFRDEKPQKAISAYQNALKYDSENVLILSNLGAAYKADGRLNEARLAYQHALAIEPNNGTLYFNLGNTLKEQLDYEGAISSFEKARKHAFSDVSALALNTALCLYGLERSNEALTTLEKELVTHPDRADLWAHLGILQTREGQCRKGIRNLERAIILDRYNAEWHFQLGIALCESNERKGGLQSLQQALSVNPKLADAELALSLELLRQECFEEGWDHYEARWRACKTFPKQLHYREIVAKPEWSPGAMGAVLAWGEQGIGDELMFGSLMPDLIERSRSPLIVQADPRLEPLLRRSLGSPFTFIANHTPIESESYGSQIAMGSMPRLMRKSASDFEAACDGYLLASTERTQQLLAELNPQPGQRLIGISWDSKSERDWNQIKRIALHDLAVAIASPSVRLINLQYGDTDQEVNELYQQTGIKVEQLSDLDRFHDLDGVAALIQACDSVVTISNCVAHLCGALGQRGHLLLPRRSDWRWGIRETSTYWYSSLILYRQRQDRDWTSPLTSLKKALMQDQAASSNAS
jgi:tetratricopeptide (TPR) repeat protein